MINKECQYDTLSEGIIKMTCYFSNGTLMSQKYFKDGILHGELIDWDSLGRIISQHTFRNGISIGKSILNDYEHGIYCVGEFDVFGFGCSECRYENGLMMEKACNDSTRRVYGEFKQWYRNGQLALSTYQNQGKQDFVTYHDNGKFDSKGKIFDSPFAKIGIWKYFDRDGQNLRKEKYSRRHPGVKHGRWVYYENDTPVVIEFYKNNVLQKIRKKKSNSLNERQIDNLND